MPSRPDLRLDWASAEAARYACERWHYSGTLPANKSNRIGVWECGQFKGCIVFGLGASPSLGKPYGLGIFEICELTRVALRDHSHAVSRMVAIALRIVRAHNPGLRLCVSFADTFHGHHGGIYQAGGWFYGGKTSPSKIWKLPNGDLADPRRFNGHGHNSPAKVPVGSILLSTPGKHRYLMPFDSAMREQIAALAKPYPKRAKDQASTYPVDLGGETPTRALQLSEAA